MQNNIFNDNRLNYKDFLIILISWYFISLSSYFISEKDFASLTYINDLLSFAINVLAHMSFLIIIYSYFNLLYDFNLKDLGFNLKINKKSLKIVVIIVIILLSGVILINLNLNLFTNKSYFPLNLQNNLFAEVFSNLPLIFIVFFALFFTAGVEQFLFNKVIFSLFDLYLPNFIASILTALFAPFLFLEFSPALILILFFSVLISNYLYIISDYNLFAPILFYSSFLTFYSIFIYGFDFIFI